MQEEHGSSPMGKMVELRESIGPASTVYRLHASMRHDGRLRLKNLYTNRRPSEDSDYFA